MIRANLLLVALAMTVCNAALADRESGARTTDIPEPGSVQRFYPMPTSFDGTLLDVSDPFEGFNRAMYSFNAGFDRAVFLPVISGYQWLMPDPAEHGVSSFFRNLFEVRNFVNNVLQGHAGDAVATLGRFTINTTLGLGGLLDPATKMGLDERREDFGQTLGYWGLGAGPYLVLPVFGPSSLRDTGGLLSDAAFHAVLDPLDALADPPGEETRLALNLLRSVDIRANTAFRYHATGSPFEYELVRYTYIRMREVEIER